MTREELEIIAERIKASLERISETAEKLREMIYGKEKEKKK